MANNSNFGQIYQLAGVGGVTNALQSSSPIQAGATTFVLFKAVIVTDASSTMTAVAIKCQGVFSAGGSDVGDLISYKLDTNTSQPELSHSYSGLTTGTTSTFFFKCKDPSGFAGGIQVAVQGTFSSGTSRAGDSVTISAVGW